MYEAAALAATKSMVAVALYKLMVSEYKIDVSLEKKTSTAQVLATLVTEQDTAKEGDTLAALLTFNFPAFLFASVCGHSSFFFFFALWFRIFFFFFALWLWLSACGIIFSLFSPSAQVLLPFQFDVKKV